MMNHGPGADPATVEMLAADDHTVADVLADADLVRIEMPDLQGALRGKLVAAEKLRGGSTLGFPRGYLGVTVADELIEWGPGASEHGHGDMLAVPDWSTACRVPEHPRTVSVLCDGVLKDGSPDPANPRAVLKRVVRDLADAGYTARIGMELEFWCFRLPPEGDAVLRDGRGSELVPVCRGGHTYELSRLGDYGAFAEDLIEAMQQYGAPVESMVAEGGHGILEVALAATDPVAAADGVVRFKLCAREVAARHGLVVSFMAKLSVDAQGCSGHIHQSLLRDGRNAFWSGGPNQLSEVASNYLAGLLMATKECGAFMAPYPNSYRRFDPTQWAPDTASWAFDNRHVCVRAIVDGAASARFEQRRPGADFQPYLSLAASLAGGLHGLRHGLEPPLPVGQAGPGPEAAPLAAELSDAVSVLRESTFARQSLGSDVVDLFVATSEAEVAAWSRLRDAHIPPWEINRYLEVV